MPALSRRDFVKNVAVASAAASVLAGRNGSEASGQTPAQPLAPKPITADQASQGATLRWLAPAGPGMGVTAGVSWPRGASLSKHLELLADGAWAPSQTSVLAYWPDGSWKWTAHAIAPGVHQGKELKVVLAPEARRTLWPDLQVRVQDTDSAVEVDTGVIRVRVAKKGVHLFEQIERAGRVTAKNGRLVAIRQDGPDAEVGHLTSQAFESAIEKVTLEQTGPVRAVVKLEGSHSGDGRQWLPFVVRLYFYAGSDAVRVMHSFIFDGDEHKDFIRGLGVRVEVPMTDLPHDRHVRLSGELNGERTGLFGEGIRNLSGLRRDPGREVTSAQFEGRKCPPVSQITPAVRDRLELIPQWDSFSLFQSTADAFTITKRTGGKGVGTITAGHGTRSTGLAYIGGASGGVALGLRDFWQRHPTELEITGASTDTATLTAWLYSPKASAMDLRFYHDGLGQDTFAKQLEGLNITYEDYEPGFGTPYGVARSSELYLWACEATPPRETLARMAAAVAEPPVLVCDPGHYHACEVFGARKDAPIWSLPDRSTERRAKIEDQLAWQVEFYRGQVEDRRWYGFWDYGDVMHTYDPVRHTWRYDVGGYAWDNSELSPDLWLWMSFLRTGDRNTFRLAEAMTRHTGEVDVYHIGRFKMLGTRHNVQHWGCSAKQLRISTVAYRRYYYYLSGGDERIGDLMRDLRDSEETFLGLDPIRKVRTDVYAPQRNALSVGFGTDWGSLAAAWLAEWERTAPGGEEGEKYKNKLLTTMRTIGAMPRGFYTAGARFNLDTSEFIPPAPPADPNAVGWSHLSALFGLPEVCAELIQLLDVPAFEKAWLDYCQYTNAPRAERAAAIGVDLKTDNQVSSHARLTAYAAVRRKDPKLAERAWTEFFADDRRWAPRRYVRDERRIEGPDVISPVREAPWMSTNDASQWGLSAMVLLSLVPEALASARPSWEGTGGR